MSPTLFQTSNILKNQGNIKIEKIEKGVKTCKIWVLGFTFVASHHITSRTTRTNRKSVQGGQTTGKEAG